MNVEEVQCELKEGDAGGKGLKLRQKHDKTI